MDKYRRVVKPRNEEVRDDAEIRVTAVGSVAAYISRAAKLFNEMEKQQLKITATGNALTKAVTAAEVIKRRFKGVHQITKLVNQEITDVYEPLEEGLDTVTQTRNMAAIEIILSKEKLDSADKGYQDPIDEDLVKEMDPEDLAMIRGGGSGGGKGKGNNHFKGKSKDRSASLSSEKGKSKGNGKDGMGKGKGKVRDESLARGKGKSTGKGNGNGHGSNDSYDKDYGYGQSSRGYGYAYDGGYSRSKGNGKGKQTKGGDWSSSGDGGHGGGYGNGWGYDVYGKGKSKKSDSGTKGGKSKGKSWW